MKEDLRVVRTRNAIENAFISLIEEKGFENVKMVDIASRANVNRNTIYLHYETKEMIMERIIERVFTNELIELNIEQYPSNRFSKRVFRGMFVKIFQVLFEHIELYRIILTDHSLYGYLNSQINRIKHYLLSNVKSTKHNEIIIEYIVYGVFGIIQNWIIYDKGSIDENVDIIVSLLAQNIRHVQLK